MCTPGYHHNDSVAIHAVGHMMYGCAQVHEYKIMCPSAWVATKPLWW